MRRTVNTSSRLLILTVLYFTVAAGAADVEGDLELTDVRSLTDLVVEIRDDQGQPVAGAAVMVYAMRMKEDAGHGYWNHKKLGAPKTVTSDDNGIAVVQYPASVYYAPQKMTTRLVSFSIQHAEFVAKFVHFDLGPKQADVTLKRGCEIQLSAVDANGSPITDFGVAVAGPYAPSMWAADENGGRRTGAASDGIWQTMIVKPQEDGRTLFSTVLPLRVRPNQAVRIRNVRLEPGTRVNGRLSDNVPRPVKDGYVVAVTVPKPANDAWNSKDPSLTWSQWEPIDRQGAFQLKSVPTSGEIQIIAFCDGWVAKTTYPNPGFFVMGQSFPIEGEQLDVSVEMEPTGTLELTISSPDGEPLRSGMVSCWPNQKYAKGGSTMLGARPNSMRQIENQLLPADQQKPAYSRDFSYLPFIERPVTNGEAILKGLPLDRNLSLVLQHSQFMFASDSDNGEVQFTVNSGDPKPLKLQTKAITKN